MKITKSQLTRIIKEELEEALRTPEPKEYHGEISRAYNPEYDDPDISRRREAPKFMAKIDSMMDRTARKDWINDLANAAADNPWGDEGEKALYYLKRLADSSNIAEAEYAQAMLDAVMEERY